MRQHRNAARAVDQLDRFFGRKARARDVSRAVVADVAVEGILDRFDVARFEHRAGDVRTTNRAAVGNRHDAIPFQRHIQRRQFFDHPLAAPKAVVAKARQRVLKFGIVDVDVIAEHVNIAVGILGAQFNAGDDDGRAILLGGLLGLCDAFGVS